MNGYSEFLYLIKHLNHPSYEYNGCQVQWSLDKIREFDNYLGNPSQKLSIIHVTGTNGKGSTSSMIANALWHTGLKVGTYNSPHIFDLRERIKINGKKIPIESIAHFMVEVKNFLCFKKASLSNPERALNSYSELLFELAFYYFVLEKVDIVVLEVGIGGEHDPSYIVKTPLVAVITSIGLDHTDIFGYSINNITKEKCAIAKNKCPLVVGHVTNEISDIIKQFDRLKDNDIFFVDSEFDKIEKELQISYNKMFDLKGDYQKENVKTACVTLSVALKRFKQISASKLYSSIYTSLTHTSRDMDLWGRWQVINNKPYIVVDICSNTFGLRMNLSQIEKMMSLGEYKRLVFILGLGCSNNLEIRDYLPRHAVYYYTEHRGFIHADDLAKGIGFPGYINFTVKDSIMEYTKSMDPYDFCYIGGSFNVGAEALKWVKYLSNK